MCIGNRDGGDDGIGPYIADYFLQQKNKDMVVLDCGTAPENFTGVIKQHKPEKLIIIDAVDMRLQPGEIRIVPPDTIGRMHISTHGIPLSVLIDYLEQFIDEIIVIGIQPGTLSGDTMSPSVVASGKKLIEMINNKTYFHIKTFNIK